MAAWIFQIASAPDHLGQRVGKLSVRFRWRVTQHLVTAPFDHPGDDVCSFGTVEFADPAASPHSPVTVHGSRSIIDRPFMNDEQLGRGHSPPAIAARPVPVGLHACSRRCAPPDHLDRLPADRRTGKGNRRPADRARRPASAADTAGQRLADHAVTILAAIDAARLDLDPDAEPAGTVRVGGFATGLRVSLFPIVADLAQRYPKVDFVISEFEPIEAFALLTDDDLDLALTYDYNLAPASVGPALETLPLWSVAWGLGVPADAPDGPADIAAYSDRTWIVNSRNTADEDAVRTLASIAGFSPKIAHQIDSLDLVEDLIVAGYGIGLLPIGRATGSRVKVLPLADGNPILTAYAVTRRGRVDMATPAGGVGQVAAAGIPTAAPAVATPGPLGSLVPGYGSVMVWRDLLKHPGLVHTWLRVTGVLAGVESSVVLGLGFRGWAAPEPVHEPALAVPGHPRRGDVLQIGEGAERPGAKREP